MPISRIPDQPPCILPLSNQLDRPLWSVMIPVYNCSEYLKETLESVLQQAMEPAMMQIEVVDDASTDADVEAIVNEIGKGRIRYFCQAENQGSLRNFETCLNRAQGQLVHLLHGDDRVLDDFYATFTDLFQRFPDAGAAFCNYYTISPEGERVGIGRTEAAQDGILDDFFLRIAHYQRIQYVAMVVKRSVYEHLGAFYGVTYGEDWEMWARIARYYPIAYTPQVLAEYRFHNNSISSQKFTSGHVLEDLAMVINTISRYVPDEYKKELWYRSMEHYTRYQLHIIFNIWQINGNLRYLITQTQKTLKVYSSVMIYFFIVKLFIKKGVKRLLRPFGMDQKLTKLSARTTNWDWEIANKSNWWNIGLSEVWSYRNLLARLIRRDFLITYQQTLLGPIWAVFQPILTVLMFLLIFNKLVGISTGSIPPTLFYIIGATLWNLFNDVFTNTSATFTANADLFSKVYFPRLVMPLAAASAQLIRLLVQLALLAVVMLYYILSGIIIFPVTAWLLMIPVILATIICMGLSMGLLFSVITAKYRDLVNMMMFLMRMLMFATPVIFPLAIVPEGRRWIVSLNPLTPLFEAFRYALLGEGTFTTSQLLYSIGGTGVLLLVSMLLFNKQKEALMDVL